MTQQMVPSNRPGQMTAVMRAMPQVTGPKVLRIGIVQGGKVIEERVIKQRTHVTIGPSEKSMFVIPSKGLPTQFRLFELMGGDYVLNFLDGMSGLLESWGYTVVVAPSEDVALARLAEHDRSPDGIVCDYHLAPGKTGPQAIARLRRAFEIPALVIQ